MQVMSRNLPVDAVLFDLDGTLLHTSPDAVSALNRALPERGSHLSPGVEAALDGLRQMGLKLGVVTNREQGFVTPLLQRSGLSAWFDIVVDGDTLAQRKPDPAPLLHACDALGVEPAHTLYVGDSVNGALAAQAGGIAMICVSYGYSEDQPVADLPCLRVIDDLAELPELIGGPRRWRQPARAASAAYRADEQASPWI